MTRAETERLDRLERENEQLRRDIDTIARETWPHVHPKEGTLEIAERDTAGGRETRPHSADETRAVA